MKISPACKYLCVLSLLLLFAVLPASAQSYIVTFEGYGGVALATYVGPLPSVTTPTTGVTLNPSGILQVFSSFPNVTATAMQPCNFYVTGVNGISTIVCNQPPATPTTPSWSISFQTVDNGAIASGHPPAGTYVESQALNSFISEVVLGQPQTGEGIQTVTVALATATYSCSGFQAPFDVPLSLKHKTQRAIPLIMQLNDANGVIITDQTIAGGVAPVVNVTYSGVLGTGIDDTALLDPLGQSSPGNAFVYDPTTQTWQFNLSSAAFSSTGTYTVTVASGDATQYTLSPSCSGTFVRQ